MADVEDQCSTQLHLTFVEMLFALAIGEVAIDVGDLVTLQVQGTINLPTSLPVYSHLLLATIVIAASWVGWRSSEFSGSKIRSVFSLDFVELLIDVFLVVFYFLLVRLAELPTGSSGTVPAEASSETWMIVVIMASYALWDILSCRTDGSKLKLRVWASVTSFFLSLVALYLLPLESDSKGAVLFMDTALIGLVLLFRAMKLRDWGHHTKGSKALIVSLFVCCILLTVLAHIAS